MDAISRLKKDVYNANMDLVKYDLVTLTWGNVSGIDRQSNKMVIKPSGVNYNELSPDHMVVIDLENDSNESPLNPSSDSPTHAYLYKHFNDIDGIAHSHSVFATIFAQASKEIPCLGTTHADHFNGNIPVARHLSKLEVEEHYEKNTGKVIIERFKNLKPLENPAVLLSGHAPFSWGKSPKDAVKNLLILERVAKMALDTMNLNSKTSELPDYIQNKHYLRKHGPNAYYGQTKSKD